MGCGGSKDDVATGNVVARRSSLPGGAGESSAGRRNRTSKPDYDDDDAGMPSEKKVIVNEQANGGRRKDSSEEFFDLAAAGSESAEYLSVDGDAEAGATNEERSEGYHVEKAPEGRGEAEMESTTQPATREEEEEEKVVVFTAKEDDGESIGNESADCKETIYVEEPKADQAADEEEIEEDPGESRIETHNN